MDIQSNNRLVVPNTLEDLQGLLDYSRTMNLNFGVLGERASDNSFIPEANFKTIPTDEKAQYLWQEALYTFPNDWSTLYTVVYNSNLALEKLQKIERHKDNSVSWDQVKGSALLFRASAYLNLLWTHSNVFNTNTAGTDLGIVLRESSDFNVPSFRSSVKDGYGLVLTDLKAAISLLPTEASHVMRPSKIAAYGLLARAYLSMRDYKQALTYANLYLEIKNGLMNYNDQTIVKITANYPFAMFNEETAFYMQLRNSNLTAAYTNVDSTLYKSYEEDDLRKTAFFKKTNAVINFKGQYTGTSSLFGGIATDEMYLVRAECLARETRLEEALSDLNRLLITRYKTGTFTPFQNMSASQVLERVLIERRKELLYRGLRWIDIKRLNLEGKGISLVREGDGVREELKPNDNRYAIPLPADIIRLTGMPQNPR